MTTQTERFTQSLPLIPAFAEAFEQSGFTPLPEDWVLAVTDVVQSRKAIAEGRYKAVNMAGAAMISAAINALNTRMLPYIFGGDGAAVAISAEEIAKVQVELARLIVFAQSELQLELRAAIVPLSRIRADGRDVRVKAVRVSDAIRNYAFDGGGIAHAEALMKAGEYRIAAAADGIAPDLTGLSCRWQPISAPGRTIVSVIVEPASGLHDDAFTALARTIAASAGGEGDASSPVPSEGPGVGYPPQGLDMEARLTRGNQSVWRARLRLYAESLLGWVLFRTGIRMGGFDPVHYRRATGLNTDFRKWQDGLRMTVSMNTKQLADLKTLLERERGAGRIRYGLSEQDSAVLTCFVPSVLDDEHFHFLDGAGGGYAAAASAMA